MLLHETLLLEPRLIGVLWHYSLQYFLDASHQNSKAYKTVNIAFENVLLFRAWLTTVDPIEKIYTKSLAISSKRALVLPRYYMFSPYQELHRRFYPKKQFAVITEKAVVNNRIPLRTAELIPVFGKSMIEESHCDFYSYVLENSALCLKDIHDVKFINKILGVYKIIGKRLVRQYIQLLKDGITTTQEQKIIWECIEYTKSLNSETYTEYKKLRKNGQQTFLKMQAKYIRDALCGSIVLTKAERSVPYFKDIQEYVYWMNGESEEKAITQSFLDNSRDLTTFTIRDVYPISGEIRKKHIIATEIARYKLVTIPFYVTQTKNTTELLTALKNNPRSIEIRDIIVGLAPHSFSQISALVTQFNSAKDPKIKVSLLYELSLLYEVSLKKSLLNIIESILSDADSLLLSPIFIGKKHDESKQLSSRFLKYINATYARKNNYIYTEEDLSAINRALETQHPHELNENQLKIFALKENKFSHSMTYASPEYMKYALLNKFYGYFSKEIAEIEVMKDTLTEKRPKKVYGYITKNPETAHARYSAGVCVYQDKYPVTDPRNLWNQQNFIQMVFQDKNTDRCMGLVLMHYYIENGLKVLSVAINPTLIFKYAFSDEEILDGILSAIETFAVDNHIDYVVASRNRNIRTNLAGGLFEIALIRRINKLNKSFRFQETKLVSDSSQIPFKEMDVLWSNLLHKQPRTWNDLFGL